MSNDEQSESSEATRTWRKEVGKMAFFAVLNLVDFVTDILVLLQFACVVKSSHDVECDHSPPNIPDSSNASSGDASQCQVHPWWVVISSLLLLSSCTVSAAFYSKGRTKESISNSRDSSKFRDNSKYDDAVVMDCARVLSFIVAFMQLAPFMDLLQALCQKRLLNEGKRQAILEREVVLKLIESAPQAFFQAYILFALEAHGQTLRVFSLAVSISSLSLSLTMALPRLTTAEEMLAQPLKRISARASQIARGINHERAAVIGKSAEEGLADSDGAEHRVSEAAHGSTVVARATQMARDIYDERA
mmetsp:Transcript_50405/g.117584  ORF Transcript_50405/g.117584 Transcript_50405/m.117584 type:complete len:304 (+) Transcript_50405:49-960(+)